MSIAPACGKLACICLLVPVATQGMTSNMAGTPLQRIEMKDENG
jgi:hypothetical protein